MADAMSIDEAAHEWHNYAESDLDSAEYLVGQRQPHREIIAFHCQQAAEKALKGLLVLHGTRPPKIHDLEKLHGLCKAVIPAIDPLLVHCKGLNDYSVGPRYPEEVIVTETKMHKALADAKAVMEFARPLFPVYEQVVVESVEVEKRKEGV
jgi:HEPN domain-containing protein